MGKIHKLLKKLNEQLTGEQAGDEASAKAEIAAHHLEQLKSGLADLQKKSPDLQKPLQSLLRNVSEYSAEDFKQRPPFVTFRDSWRVWLKQLMKDAPAADDADAFVSHAAEILAQAKALQMIDEVYGREGDWDDYRGASRDREDFGSDNISETMSTKSMDFDAWMSKVNAEVDKLSGMRADDLPDVAYRDWYDDGLAPSRAARRAIKNAEMGEDVGKPEGGNPAAALGEEMSRKHYEAIAKILSRHKNWDDIVAALTDLFKSDNPRFSADEFKKAVNTGASQEEIEGVASSIRENIYDTLQEYRRENKYGMPWASLDKAIESHRDSAAELLKIDTGKKMSEADWKAIWEQTYKITRLTWSKDFNSKVGDPDAKEPKTEGGDPKAALGEAMSRQEYASIAHVIRGNTTKEEIANQLAGVFVANDNRFDREQFLKAAGVALAENTGKPKPGLSPRGHGPVDQRQINKDRAAADRDFEHEKKFGRAK